MRQHGPCYNTNIWPSFSFSLKPSKKKKKKLFFCLPNFTKWANTLKQFVGKLPTNCLNVFDHFVGLALKGLR